LAAGAGAAGARAGAGTGASGAGARDCGAGCGARAAAAAGGAAAGAGGGAESSASTARTPAHGRAASLGTEADGALAFTYLMEGRGTCARPKLPPPRPLAENPPPECGCALAIFLPEL